MPKQFHLAWFVSRGFSPKAWRFEWAGDTAVHWLKPDLFVDLARSLERAFARPIPSLRLLEGPRPRPLSETVTCADEFSRRPAISMRSGVRRRASSPCAMAFSTSG